MRALRKEYLKGFFAILAMTLIINGIAASVYAEMQEPDSEVSVELNDDYFNPEDIILPAGKQVTLNLENKGRKPHTFTVNDLKIDVDLQPGEERNITLEPVSEGTYELICRFHREQGMVGKVIVE